MYPCFHQYAHFTIVIIIDILAHLSVAAGARYCNMENFNATCGMDEVILVQRARYGRMDVGRCVTAAYGFVGCSADVISHLDRKCSGKRRCHFIVPDPEIYGLRPCPEDLTSYLEVVYDCVKGLMTRNELKANFCTNTKTHKILSN